MIPPILTASYSITILTGSYVSGGRQFYAPFRRGEFCVWANLAGAILVIALFLIGKGSPPRLLMMMPWT